MSAKRAINDKLQGSVATYLRCDESFYNQIKKGLLLSPRAKEILKSVSVWQSYKHKRGCLMRFARLANTPLKDEESARDNHVLACNFAKYSPIKKITDRQSQTADSARGIATWKVTLSARKVVPSYPPS